MLLSPPNHSTAADLLRLLAAWLAAIVLFQGVAAAQALGQGPLHRHRAVAAAGDMTPADHHHGHADRHVHALADPTVLHVGADPDSIDATAFALTAALALMLLGRWLGSAPDDRRQVWQSASAWTCRSVVRAVPLRPPRLV